MGKRWRELARKIRERDAYGCRHCGQAVGVKLTSGHVDHLIPRRLFVKGEDANFQDNLCTLCGRCHAIKTHEIEPSLYSGEAQRFQRFLEVVSWSGPIPRAHLLAIAFSRAAAALRRG